MKCDFKRFLTGFTLFFIMYSSLIAQNFDRIPVSILFEGKMLQSGPGLRAPQFCNINLNGDDQSDLLVYDRVTDLIHTYIKTGAKGEIKFEYAPQYEDLFPRITNFVRLADFNRDGIEDIFTASNANPGAIDLYRGSRDNSGNLSYKLVTFDYGIKTSLMIPAGNGFTGIYASIIDLPDMVDIDSDGDIDVLAFDPDGSFVSWYQNLQEDEGLKKDTLKFKIGEICWGKFSEGGNDDSIFLSDDPFSCANGLVSNGETGSRHSGSTLSLMDLDGDADYEIAIGDISSNTIKMLTNTGTSDRAHMTAQERGYPINDASPFFNIFLSPIFVDIDGDDKLDMIVTVNERVGGESVDHIWAYQNVSNTKIADFKLKTKRFLIDDFAYFNGSSAPTFIDIDNDGLHDIIIGTNKTVTGTIEKKQRLVYLRNTGTSSSPSYKIEDDDYLGLAVFYPVVGQRFRPSAGDIDGDGDVDLMVGISNGTLCFVENTAGKSKPAVWATPKAFYKEIFVGNNTAPAIFDLDRDGLMDLICGENNNQFNFLKNIGSTGNPDFLASASTLPNTDELGGVFKSGNDVFTRNSDPHLVETFDGLRLVLSNEYGNLSIWSDIYANEIYNQNYLRIDSLWGIKNRGKFAKISLADIDNDGYYEMAVGNEAGGMEFFNTPLKLPISSSEEETVTLEGFSMYPNPAGNYVYINATYANKSYDLLDISGRIILALKVGYNDLSSVSNGYYFVKSKDNSKASVLKLIITR